MVLYYLAQRIVSGFVGRFDFLNIIVQILLKYFVNNWNCI